MHKKLIGLAVTAVLAVSSTTAMANCDPGEIVIKFSHVTNTDKHPKGIAASLLEKRVNSEMNGKACMQVFPNSTLYNDKKVLEAMLSGDVQMAAPSLSKFEKFTKKFRIFDLPFLFEDVNAVDRFQNSADGEKLKGAMKRRGLSGLAFWHNGMKQMSASKPLVSPADAKGLKFRVQASDVLVAQFEQLGANPQKMSFKEVYGGETELIGSMDKSVAGKSVGDIVEVMVPPEDGFGVHDPDLTFTDDLENVPSQFRQLGAEVQMQGENGEVKNFYVTKIEDNKLTVDGNHPLAGKTLKVTVKILEVRDATIEDMSPDAGSCSIN